MVLIVGYFSLGSFLQFRKPSEKILEKDLSILTYNTFGFKGLKSGKKNIKNNGENIINFINKQNPDIICFQEFDYKRIKSGELDSYPYSYVDFEFGSKGKSIQAIYSKYKIINKGNFNFPNTANNAIFVDILYKEDTMRLYNVHLQSLNIRPRMIKDENSNKLYSRLASSFSKQEEQAKLILEDQKNNTHLKVICGDFNNTQYSNIYKLLKGDKNDTFIEKGSGYDRSYNFYHFPLRIDFILSDKELKVRSHKKFNLKYSDHFPVMASFSLE
ncbi:endonuclease/exonuclease/phosphatase family protein [Maribacter vaceletii]|uniref:endonuclease/exonuclease/phosphatase family protein n=1 Tax=Maribacter vaceletii TaxID=1206816 RepID=UPI00147346A6|nr:endonuclease/exonuclease/phosphatase family protein [Maribacter vaceletii]